MFRGRERRKAGEALGRKAMGREGVSESESRGCKKGTCRWEKGPSESERKKSRKERGGRESRAAGEASGRKAVRGERASGMRERGGGGKREQTTVEKGPASE
jgi:hypothetical protein